MTPDLQPEASEVLNVKTSSGEFSQLHVLSIILSLYLAYPILATLFHYAGIANDQGTRAASTLFGQMLFGYLVIWPFRIAAVVLLLKRRKAGWLVAFTFFVAEVVFLTLSGYNMWNYQNGDAGFSGFLSNFTGYVHYYVFVSFIAAMIMLWNRYREYFGITQQNIFVCLAIGIISGIILQMLLSV